MKSDPAYRIYFVEIYFVMSADLFRGTTMDKISWQPAELAHDDCEHDIEK